MLLPRFSIRTILYVAVAVAVFALVGAQAVDGAEWALAVTLAVGSLPVVWLVFVLFYAMVAGFARVALRGDAHAASSAYYPEPRRGSSIAAEGQTPAPPTTRND